MTDRPDNDALLQRARRLFREQEAATSIASRERLAAARRRALAAAARPRRRAVSVLGPALAAALVMAVWFWPGQVTEPGLDPTVAFPDLELLFSAEEWELIDDLDFYLLLAELEEDAGHG